MSFKMRETLNRSLLTEAKWTGKRLNYFLNDKKLPKFYNNNVFHIFSMKKYVKFLEFNGKKTEGLVPQT